MTKTEIVNKLKKIERLYLWVNLVPLIAIIGSMLIPALNIRFGEVGLVISRVLGFLIFIVIITIPFLSYIIFSHWAKRLVDFTLGEKNQIRLNSIIITIFTIIPIIPGIFYIFNWSYTYNYLGKVNEKLKLKLPLLRLISTLGIPLIVIFFSFLVTISSERYSSSDISTLIGLLLILLILVLFLVKVSIIIMMRRVRKAIEKTNLDLPATTEQLKPNNKNTDIPKLTDFITSKNWQYAKNGKLFFIKFNQGSIAEVTAKEDTQEIKFYNWRINNSSLFCDNPDFEGGGQILGDLIQFKNLTLSPKLSDKTFSSIDNK